MEESPDSVRRFPAEQPLTVFVSSVIAGLEMERAVVADVGRSVGLDVWVFEQTPASSQDLVESYLAYVEKANWVIWLVVDVTIVVALGTGLRRGALLGLAWGDVALLDRRLTVRRAIVRGAVETPKSRASRRTLEVGPVTAAALEEQLAETGVQERR